MHRLNAPVEALVHLVETTFDYHADHPDYIRIICMENMRDGIAGAHQMVHFVE
jgi:hypothetical protein